MTPRPTIERVWLTYLGCVLLIAGLTPGGGGPMHSAGKAALLHGGLAGVMLAVGWLARRSGADAVRALRALLALAALPAVFSALCWLLPGVHPEPFEYRWLALDRAVFGDDVARLVDGWLSPWLVEGLQLVYASFYGLAIAAVLGAGLGAGRAAFDRAMLQVVGGFLVSYLGYLLVPTLAPKLVLAHASPPVGLWLTPLLQQTIDAGELNPWDCFPSGHTMLTIVALVCLWRWNRRWFRWLVVPGGLLILSTVLLRYHWVIDVVAGAVLAAASIRWCDRLADRDGWPRAERGGVLTPG